MAGKTETTPKQTAGGCLLMVVVAVAGVFGFKACTGGSSPTSYSAVQDGFIVVNPADLAVTLKVTNTGSKSGTPQCEVDAHDPSYTYTGVDIGSLADPVAPGATVTAVMNLSISKSGAAYVTDVTVKCS